MFWNTLWQALQVVTTPEILIWIFTGTVCGIIIGAIPGIGPALGCALALPFTVYIDPLKALLFMVTLYDGAMYGGSISSILINTPGDGPAAASTIEGYPMAQQGKAISALSISASSSTLGGILGSIIGMFFSVFMLSFLMLFGTPEYFLLGILGIVLIAMVSKGSYYKAIISGFFGLAITTIGIAPGASADVRYTFGALTLYDGISFLPVLLGLFGVATMAQLKGEDKSQISDRATLGGKRLDGVRTTFRNWATILKSSVIGFLIGSMPGTGGTVATFVAYGEAVRSSADKTSFGKGNPKGLVATESANNAAIKGALMPTILFGIPGSATTAILLAAMLIHGLRPGMSMFQGQGYVITLALFLGLIVSEIMIIIIGLSMVRILGKVTTIDKNLIIPLVIVLSVLGIFSLKFSWFDLCVMGGAGILGFALQRFGFPVIPAVIGIILGKIIEENLLRTMELGGGSLFYLLSKPASLILILCTITALVAPVLNTLFKGKRTNDTN